MSPYPLDGWDDDPDDDTGEHDDCVFGDSCPYRDPNGDYLDPDDDPDDAA